MGARTHKDVVAALAQAVEIIRAECQRGAWNTSATPQSRALIKQCVFTISTAADAITLIERLADEFESTTQDYYQMRSAYIEATQKLELAEDMESDFDRRKRETAERLKGFVDSAPGNAR